jgi:hypothetical protein
MEQLTEGKFVGTQRDGGGVWESLPGLVPQLSGTYIPDMVVRELNVRLACALRMRIEVIIFFFFFALLLMVWFF